MADKPKSKLYSWLQTPNINSLAKNLYKKKKFWVGKSTAIFWSCTDVSNATAHEFLSLCSKISLV